MFVCVCCGRWGGGGGMRTDVNVHLYGVVNILVDSHMLGGGGGGGGGGGTWGREIRSCL